ncbi:hypothetical protein GGR58DRAFT_496838 [Xylaria digitata]|nr:hypothetical protein GGR58DRAFT_496838 [Xylaria digitata]
MSPSRDVQSLYEITDKIESRNQPKETLDAKSLLRLIKNEAVAFRRPDSSKLRELVDCFRRCQELAARYPDSEQLKDSILQWMITVDECFFFKTLTREVKTKKGRQHVVTLKIEEGSFSRGDSHDRKGIWDSYYRTITLWLKGEELHGNRSYRFPIETILHTLIHESIHAFIWLFEDDEHPKHQERVADDGMHGTIFCEMLRVIGERVGEVTNSREWKQVCYTGYYGPEEKRPNPVYPPTGPPGFGGAGSAGGPRPLGFPPGGFPPGGFPPGGFPPGGFPPGRFPHGGFPPGRFPPGGFPPGGFPPGGFPPGRFPFQ